MIGYLLSLVFQLKSLAGRMAGLLWEHFTFAAGNCLFLSATFIDPA
jgi:hypothetical protein